MNDVYQNLSNIDIEKVSKLDIKKDTEGEELKVAAESKIMKKEKIKESIKSYILENYSKKKIEEFTCRTSQVFITKIYKWY